MKRSDNTGMGGPREHFETTDWGELRSARTGDEKKRHEVLNDIFAKYWKPVYCYLRRKGLDNEAAKDLTQDFFQDVVLHRNLVQRADPGTDPKKGRFRNFLRTALDRYAKDRHSEATAKKRIPKDRLFRLDASEAMDELWACASSEPTPDEAFAYAWARALLEQVASEVEAEYRMRGKAKHWEVFSARFLSPTLYGTEAPSLGDLCARCGIADVDKASNMVITVKRKFKAAIRRCVRSSVSSDREVDGEIREIMGILARGGAGS